MPCTKLSRPALAPKQKKVEPLLIVCPTNQPTPPRLDKITFFTLSVRIRISLLVEIIKDILER